MSFEIIKKRLDEYISLQTTLKTSPEKITRHGFVTIYLGDDYFVDLTPDQAISFLERRISVLQKEVDTVQHLSGINEEGLPIMDIFEELDDDDNVVNSRVDRAASAFEHLQMAMGEEKTQPGARQLEPKKVEPEEPRIKEVEESRITEMEPEPKTMEIDTPEPTYNGISKDDLLELHLVENELDFDDEDDMEIDLDELDIDDDEDDDEDTEPLHGSLFPQSQRVRELLTKQFPGLEEDRKAVRFAESLEVREFETSSDERKGLVIDEPEQEPVKEEPKRKGVSQFKLRRGGAPSVPTTTESPRILTQVVEKEVSPVVKKTVSEVVEKPSETVGPVSEVMERPVEVSKPVSEPKPPSKPRSVYSRRYKVPESRPAATPLAAPKTPQPDPAYEGLGYIRDEDTETRKQLEEEAMELFEQSTIPDEDFLAMHGDELEDEPDQPKDDRPILSAVSERDGSEPVDSDEIEKHNDMREIRLEYQRLRQRLVHKAGGYGKTDKEMETEAIDEEGNPQKMSRFKAARIGMR